MIKLFLLLSGFLIVSLPLQAETEDEEMARMQRELNRRLFAPEDKPAPPAPAPAPVAAKVESEQEADNELPESVFTNYRLAGVSLTMGKSEVMSKLEAEGYSCNIPQMGGMKIFKAMGRSVCVYASMEAPKMVMFSIKNGSLRDFELYETYKSGFPEEIFKRSKKTFMKKYGNQARCKNQRKGETCEVFGQRYRIVLRSEVGDNEAKIIRSMHRL